MLRFALIFFSFQLPAGEKPSLKAFQTQLQGTSEITRLFRTPAAPANEKPNPKALQNIRGLVGSNAKLREEFFRQVDLSAAFVRGEIDDEKTLDFLTHFLELSILKLRMDFSEGLRPEISSEVTRWFNFAADLAYEESSLIGLRLAHVIRSLLLDELEREWQQKPEIFNDASTWVRKLRAPWPVDRVFLFESRRVLAPASLSVADRVAKAFQKNPYQTAEQILSHTPGGNAKDLEFLKSIWRDSDLREMKEEVNRLSRLRVHFAQTEFAQKNNRPAKNWDDLIKGGLIDQIPIDYQTGHPMPWSQL